METTEKVVSLTDEAIEKVTYLLSHESEPDLFLRMQVQPGGCSGLRYGLFFDNKVIDGDNIQSFKNKAGDEVRIHVDKMSTPYLSGASVDFVDSIEKQGFTIDNPNASGGCACGESFS